VIVLDKEIKKEESKTAEKTPDGKYKCKICGQIFPTMEAHDEHHRKMHKTPKKS
jgi:hypothetical protein